MPDDEYREGIPPYLAIAKSSMSLINKANLINRYYPERFFDWLQSQKRWATFSRQKDLDIIEKVFGSTTGLTPRTKAIMETPAYKTAVGTRAMRDLGLDTEPPAPAPTPGSLDATLEAPEGFPESYVDDSGITMKWNPYTGTYVAISGGKAPSDWGLWTSPTGELYRFNPETGEIVSMLPGTTGLSPSEEEQRRQWEIERQESTRRWETETAESKRQWEIEQQRLADQLGLSRQQLEQSQKQWAAQFGMTQKEFAQRQTEWMEQMAWQKEQSASEMAWQKEQAAQQQAYQQEQMAWQKEQWGQQLAQQQKQYLAQLAANPLSWLEYASASGTSPAVQPWMIPLAGREYGLEVGGRIPGYSPSSMKRMPELTTPSAQYWGRMGPTAQAQYMGYEKARTGITPEEVAWRLGATAPPGGGYRSLVQTR